MRPISATLPIVPIRVSQPRHSIVDLSSVSNGSGTGDPTALDKKTQIRRPVASKRRPSASMRAIKTTFPVSNEFESNGDKTQTDAQIQNREELELTETPGCRLVLKEFRKRSCAVYEPLLTLRALGTFRPLFFRCVDYIETHMDDFKEPEKDSEVLEESQSSAHSESSSISSASVSSDLPQLVKKLREVAYTFLTELHHLQENDDSLMQLVQELEKENKELYRYQLSWCCDNSHKVDGKQTPQNEDLFTMDPWQTPMVNRLERLEEKKKQIGEFERIGSEICSNLDNLIRENLTSIVSLMERLSTSSNENIRMSSSLSPHPSLFRRKPDRDDHEPTTAALSEQNDYPSQEQSRSDTNVSDTSQTNTTEPASDPCESMSPTVDEARQSSLGLPTSCSSTPLNHSTLFPLSDSPVSTFPSTSGLDIEQTKFEERAMNYIVPSLNP